MTSDIGADESPRLRHAILRACVELLIDAADGLEDFERDEVRNPMTIIRWLRKAWGDLGKKVKGKSVKRSIPIILLMVACPVLISLAWLVVFIGNVVLNTLGLVRHLRNFSQCLKRRRHKQRDAEFQERFFLPFLEEPVKDNQKTDILPSSVTTCKTQETSGLFLLPPELRYLIQLNAFGGRTIHMSLEFQHPFYIGKFDRYGDPRFGCHAKIERLVTVKDSHLQNKEPKKWIWFGCVCHRSSCEGSGDLPYLDRSSDRSAVSTLESWDRVCEPKDDRCAEGIAQCKEWPGTWPSKCQIGILGWLLTCRQAYVEGFSILYRTNTIHIASPALHRSMQDVVTQGVLSHLTSLELVWDLDTVPLDQAFKTKSKKRAQKHPSPLFSSLVSLRLAFSKNSAVATCVGLNRHAINAREIKSILIGQLFPMIDTFLDRTVPTTSEVTVSCPSWGWYSAVDLAIIDSQGKELSKAQRADIGGVKFWRESPASEATVPPSVREESDLEVGAQLKKERKGFWIHISNGEKLSGGMEMPDFQRRRELYDGDELASI